MEELNNFNGPRDEAVLIHVVREYILTGKPVSSSRVTSGAKLGLSSASVRIVLSRLEEEGWVSHPHTSAGKVPTDRGYRFYVDHLMKKESFQEEEEKHRDMVDSLHQEEAHAEDIFRAAIRLLANLSSYPSVILRPRLKELMCEAVDLIYVRPNKVMLVVTLEAQLIHLNALDFDGNADRRDVLMVSEFLHRLCKGHTLGHLPDVIREGIHLLQGVGTANSLTRAILERGLHRLERRSISWDGAPCLARHPEFIAAEDLEGLLEALERGGSIVDMLEGVARLGGCAVRIGQEMMPGPFSRCSLVASSYGIGDRHLGALAVLGPRRMRYATTVSMVRSLSRALSAALMERDTSHGGMKVRSR